MLNCQSCRHKQVWDDFVWCPIIRAFICPQNIHSGRFCDFHSGRYRNEDFGDTS
jgi:hypothetical protein